VSVFSTLTGGVIAMPQPNIDTDQIIPARYLLRSRDAGYGELLFQGGRYDAQGGVIADHPFNTAQGREARILVAGANFGCGSAREQAAYALYDFGIRVIIAPSYGEIFRLNCTRNGILPARLPEPAVELLFNWLSAGARHLMSVDLPGRRLHCEVLDAEFEIPPAYAQRLMSGKDEIDETIASYGSDISAFERRRALHLDPHAGHNGDPGLRSATGRSSR